MVPLHLLLGIRENNNASLTKGWNMFGFSKRYMFWVHIHIHTCFMSTTSTLNPFNDEHVLRE